MMKENKCIENNYFGEPGSFLYLLEEKGIYDYQTLIELFQAIYICSTSEHYTKRRTHHIMHIQTRILRDFVFHYQLQDGYVITQLPDESIVADIIDTLKTLIEEGYMQQQQCSKNIYPIQF